MVHEMKLKGEFFNLIKSGVKTYEIRLNDEKRKLIKIGDIIIFKKEPDLEESFETKVKNLIYFNSFKDMANSLPLKNVGFENKSINYVVDIYHQFYSIENETKFGVLAIEIERIK